MAERSERSGNILFYLICSVLRNLMGARNQGVKVENEGSKLVSRFRTEGKEENCEKGRKWIGQVSRDE